MNPFKTMTKKQKSAFNWLYNKANNEKHISKNKGFYSYVSSIRSYHGRVPSWVRISLQGYTGTNVLRSDDKSYLSFNIHFGERMSTQNTVVFNIHDYIYTHNAS